MNVLKLLLDLCLFQAKPQDLPSNGTLVVTATVAAIATNILTHRADGQIPMVVAMSTAQVVVFGFAIWMVLRWKSRVERFRQTVTAIFGTSALLQLVAWPVVGWLHQVQESADASMPMTLLFALSIWVLAIAVYVMKNALELGTGVSFLITIGCQVFTLIVVFIVFGQIG
jgi:hypothetical protein